MTRSPYRDDAELAALVRAAIGQVATGPELSRSIPHEQARDVMAAILDGRVDPVQAGIFLIALRMKRETDDENLGLLEAMQGATRRLDLDLPVLLDVADPYDGFDRSLPASPFLPAVLAACGLPAVAHGVADVGPKHGITTRQVLEAAGVDGGGDLEHGRRLLEDSAAGWCYVDQLAFAPTLHALLPLRELMVKRPAITTIEKLLRPYAARERTCLLVGYVHKAYPRVYLLLARAAGFDAAMVLRGVEGGVVPSLRQAAALHVFDGAAEAVEHSVSPVEFGIDSEVRAPAVPDAANDAAAKARAGAEAGLAALSGTPGPVRDALVYAAGICLLCNGLVASPTAAAERVRGVLDDGAALARFERVKAAAFGPIKLT